MFVTACSKDEYGEEKRTEKNLIVRSGISEAETTTVIIKDCARRFVLKLYRHEASRGLFATAELLVYITLFLTFNMHSLSFHVIQGHDIK